MNKAQRAYYETLSKFKKAEAPANPVPVVHTGGEGWHWKCAGCGRSVTGEPVRQYGNRWYCTCYTTGE